MSDSETPAEGANPEDSVGGDQVESSGVVSMRQLRREDLRSFLDAGINEDGDLVLEGQDLGEFVEQAMGTDEYEYANTYAKTTFPAILEALGEPAGSDILEVIAARWCGNEVSFEFERRLKKAGIPSDLWTWH
jgi:hypothetical protein